MSDQTLDFMVLQDLLVARAGLQKHRRVYEGGRRVQYSDSIYLANPRRETNRTARGSIVTYSVAGRDSNSSRVSYGSRNEPLMDKFMRRVSKNEDGHWYWIGHIDVQGYGRFAINIDGKNKTVLAHRWIFEQKVRPLEIGEVVDHRNDICGIRHCVNYEDGHLEAVTHAENSRRGRIKLSLRHRETCNVGHVLSEVGTAVDHKGTILCSQCRRDAMRKCAAGFFERRAEYCREQGIAGVFCEHGHDLEALDALGSRGDCRECHRLTEKARRDRVKGINTWQPECSSRSH